MKRPNVIYVFSDQHRAQACGYAGDENAVTPNMDRMAAEGLNLSGAVSGMPVCCPYRASLLTGQYPHHHGVFVNDVCMSDSPFSIARVFGENGYNTAYIGKWHLDGHGRSSFIPRERRQGFDYWKVMECTHNYLNSRYYQGEDPTPRTWEGYDAMAQTMDAVEYLKEHGDKKPFFLILSWGPPHDPYELAPPAYLETWRKRKLAFRPNVTQEYYQAAGECLAGYYAHIQALDEALGILRDALKESGMEEDTILIYTSDHGDMLFSQGTEKKQKPWEESIRVPFLLSYPGRFGRKGRECPVLFNSPDIMPTLLELCGIKIPESVDGRSIVPWLEGDGKDEDRAVLLQSICPSGEWHKFKGGRAYRGIRTKRYTYVKEIDSQGVRPWLLYDNQEDPFQLCNLVDEGAEKELILWLEERLKNAMEEVGDVYMTAGEAVKKWGYQVNFLGTMPWNI